jgi:hypothetical protein
MAYLKARNADPVKVADAIWLYSLVMCGNSPATITAEKDPRDKRDEKGVKIENLFTHAEVEETWEHRGWVARQNGRLKQTCLACPFVGTCRPVPSRPYYRKGKLVLREILGFEAVLTLDLVETNLSELSIDPEVQHILELADLGVAAQR